MAHLKKLLQLFNHTAQAVDGKFSSFCAQSYKALYDCNLRL